MSAVRFRAIRETDLPFLSHLYASTRAEELAPVPWSDEQKQAFLSQQFDAQHQHYQKHFANAGFDLILLDETPIGRLYVDRQDDEIRIVDIALLPEHRGRGIGGHIMRDILDEAEDAQ